MGKYCINCGKELHTGSRFCAKCGAAVLDAHPNPVPAAQPKPVPQTQTKTEVQPQEYTPPVVTPKRKSAAAPKRNGGLGTLCIVLSVLLIIQIAAVALYGWPGFAVGGKAKLPGVLRKDSFTVSEGQTAVGIDDGAAIDFGCLLDAGEKVTVEKLKPTVIDEDVEVYAYSFRLSSGQPEGAVELTIPYDDTGLSEEEELQAVCGKYLNEESGQWEDIQYTVDTRANEVHILTNHLSTYSAFKIVNPAKRNAYISEVNVFASYMTREQAEALIQTYVQQGATWQEDVASSYLSATGSLKYFGASNAHTLFSLGGAYSDLVSQPFQNSMTGLGIATACAQFAYDAYNSGLSDKRTAISAMKSTLSIAINFASAPVQLAYLGVGVVDIALTEVSTFAMSTRYESTKNMYDAYYKREGVKRRIADWRRLFTRMYKDNKADPQKALDMMTAEIDRYVQEYWEVSGSDYESWIESYDKNGNLSKYPWPNSEDRANISNIHKAELYESLHALFTTLSRDIYYDGLDARETELKSLARLLNTQYAVKIDEEPAEGKEPRWAGRYARLAPLSTEADENSWTGKLDDEGGGVIKFTLLAHAKADFPMTLELYDTAEDVKNGKVAMSVELDPFTENEQLVVLRDEGLSLDEIIGNYDMTTTLQGETQSYTAYFSKSGDKLVGESSSQEALVMDYDPATGTATIIQTHEDGDDVITVNTTLVFRRENAIITISGRGTLAVNGALDDSLTPIYNGIKTD